MVLFCLVDLKPNSLLAERQNKKIEERAQRYKSRKDSEQKNLERMCCMQTFPSNLTFIINQFLVAQKCRILVERDITAVMPTLEKT